MEQEIRDGDVEFPEGFPFHEELAREALEREQRRQLEPVVKIANRSDVSADDLNTMMVDILDAVIKTVALTEPEEDELWDKLHPQLEEFFGFPDYRSHN